MKTETKINPPETKINEETKRDSHRLSRSIIASALILIANLVFFFMLWMLREYDDVQFDQILYQIKSPITGTNGGIVGNAILEVVVVGAIVAASEAFVYIFLAGAFKNKLTYFKIYIKYSATRIALFFKKRYMSIASLSLVLSMLIFIFRLGMHTFIINSLTDSDFIEDNYVDPESVALTFPEERRNLVYIFLESMENTFSDAGLTESLDENLIPELSKLQNENVTFSSNGGKYGAYSYVGTGWTAAGMFSQTSGMPIKTPLNFDFYGADGTYMPGTTSLGDILKKEGYNQTLLLGSDAGFAARDVYFETHGNYEVIDVYTLKEEGRIPEDYWEWWGVEDIKLFDIAKEEITRLAAEGKPFNFTTLTTDTHCPGGYICEECESILDDQYSNVLRCSSKHVYEFIDWLKEQSFYENTTIILAGDHLTMAPAFLDGIDESYIRTTYNCIINAPIEPKHEAEREFGSFDMFPTTLAAMGVAIEGDRLALGTNLFSSEKTLTEIYGYDKLNEELSKSSDFYFESFYYATASAEGKSNKKECA